MDNTQYYEITTQSFEKIGVSVYFPKNMPNQRVAILEHGLAGYRDEPMIQIPAKALLEKGYTVVCFDARYALGESDGPLEKACFTRFIEDLKTVIGWVKRQEFYNGFLILGGHSLGAGSCLHYAIRHPKEVSGLILISIVYNGQFLLESYQKNCADFLAEWQQKKLLYKERKDHPEKHGYISYDHMKDALSYHLEKEAYKVQCPTLIVFGDTDISSTETINYTLYETLGDIHKKIIQIPSCGHNYKTKENQIALYEAVHDFLNREIK